jgi:hypothetical protein
MTAKKLLPTVARAQTSQTTMEELAAAVIASLSPELVLPQFRKLQENHPLGGHCYVASEAIYYLLGGRKSGYMPASITHEGVKHFYLKHRETGSTLDLTGGQFRTPPDYKQGRGSAYRQSQPSKRAAIVIARVRELAETAAA